MGVDQRTQLEHALQDRYRLERELGVGGMATVYLAHDLKHDRDVALKVLRPDLAAALGGTRFLREIRITAQLNHPNIVPLLDSGEADRFLFYVMPLVEGESLRDMLTRRGELPVSEAVSVLRDMCRALAHAHLHGVAHRDIKPENVLLSGGAAAVADFGIAKAVASSAERGETGLTSAGVAVGTPAYMAPEQAAADVAADHRVDLYALGVVAYEMLTGQAPYAGRTPGAQLAAQVSEPPEPILKRRPALPADLAALVMRLLEKRPADRPQTADEVLRAVDALNTQSGERAPASDAGSLLKRLTASRARLAAVSVTILAVATGVWFGAPRLAGFRQNACGGGRPRVLAVLPFDVGKDTANEYFAEGLTDDLAGALGKVQGLRVAARTSAYAQKGKSARLVGDALNATHVLEGTVRREGSRLHVTAELVCTTDELQLWNGTYDREVRDVFDVQGAITTALVGELRLTLTPAQGGASRTTHAVSQEARDLYWRGRYAAQANTEQGLRQAISLYEHAIALDSTYSLAYAGLATAWGWLGDVYLAPLEILPKASEATKRALALDSLNAEAYAINGYIRATADFDFAAAERSFRRGIELDPSSGESLVMFANFASAFPKTQREALAAADRAMALDPYSPMPSFDRTLCLYAMRRYDEAAAEYRHLLSISPGFFYGDIWGAAALREKGALDSALAMYRQAQVERPDRPLTGYAITLARMGHRAAAVRQLRLLEDYAKHHYQGPLSIAGVYAALGDRDAAFAALERALAVHDAWLWSLDTWPELDPLRGDPRFAALRKRLYGDYDTGRP